MSPNPGIVTTQGEHSIHLACHTTHLKFQSLTGTCKSKAIYIILESSLISQITQPPIPMSPQVAFFYFERLGAADGEQGSTQSKKNKTDPAPFYSHLGKHALGACQVYFPVLPHLIKAKNLTGLAQRYPTENGTPFFAAPT